MKKKLVYKQRETLPWEKLKERKDLVGGTVEFFHDCSFNSMLHQFTRGIITSISWDDGRPAYIRFKNSKHCWANENGLCPWENSRWKNYGCHKGEPVIRLPKGDTDPVRENAWIEDNIIVFMTANHTKVALFPRNTSPIGRPFFYRTIQQIKKTNRRMIRALTKSLTS